TAISQAEAATEAGLAAGRIPAALARPPEPRRRSPRRRPDLRAFRGLGAIQRVSLPFASHDGEKGSGGSLGEPNPDTRSHPVPCSLRRLSRRRIGESAL